MEEKIKKILKWLFNNLIKLAEIGTVIWAIEGMYKNLFSRTALTLLDENPLHILLIGKGINVHVVIILFYFLSAVLILYLLRKYGKCNTPRT